MNTNTGIVRCSLVMAAIFISAAGGRAQVNPLDATEKPENILAAESLLYSARNLLYLPDEPAKIGRLLAISRYLADIAPDDMDVQQFLGNVYQIRKNYPAAEVSLRKQLDANPMDFATWEEWQQARLDMLNTAPERIKFLKGIVDTKLYTSPQRSAAATELASIYIGQGAQDEAEKTLEQAIRLNPLNSTALMSRLDMTKDASAQMRTETMLALLKGNPRSSWVAKQLAGYLADHGLNEMALAYLDHSWKLAEGDKPLSQAMPDFAVEYVNTMLDLGQAAEAIKLFLPDLARLNTSLDFKALMVEAFDEIGDTNNAELLRKDMANTYQTKMASQKISLEMNDDEATKAATAKLALEMAWFYLVIQREPYQALKYANELKKLGDESDVAEVTLAAAEWLAGRRDAMAKLEALAPTNPMAAFLAAQYGFSTGKMTAQKNLLEGLAVAHSGLPYRLLRKLALAQQVLIPPVKDADTIKKLVNAIDPDVLKMGLKPEQYISVTCEPLASTVKLGEPIILKATLTNTGKLPIQIGKWGLLDNRLGLAVSVDKDVNAKTFTSLPLVIWPAPKILKPGQVVTGQVRVDTGVIADFLSAQPLEDINLNVQGIVSPEETGKTIISRLPSTNPQPTVVRRMGILGGTSGPVGDRYNQALGAIAYEQTKGTVSQRMNSARQVASLLQWYRDVEQEKTLLSHSLKPVVNKNILLGMMSQTLNDKTPVVRAEILAALCFTDLDGDILNQIGPVIGDPSPLVRFRIAELLGASGNKGNLKMLEMFAKDEDKFVRMIANAFLMAEQEKNKIKITK